MTNFSPLFRGLVLAGILLPATYSQSSAQTVADGASNQPPVQQTLFQDEGPKPDTPVAEKDKTPPSLSQFLNAATQGESGTVNQEDAPQIGGVNSKAPGLALDVPKEETPEEVKKKEEASIRKDAFDAVTGTMMPLKPSEIRRMLEMYDETTQAAETPVYPSPEPESAFTTISLDPGAKPLVVKTAIGNVTTINIVDVTGQPWPIKDLTWAGNFQVEQPESGSNMLRITPTSEFATGNISIRMSELNPPVILSLKSERKSVHVRLDVQIPEVGPKGVLPPVDIPVTTKAGDENLAAVLMGVPKGNVERLKVDGVDGRTSVISQGGMMYVRTPYTMLSPAWTKSVQSADGTKVYALNFTPVILLSDKGKMVRAYLSHKETADEQY
jgi:intracellular multiplication protein IcmK